MIHRDDARGHGRHEQRPAQVATVDGLLFPHARQVLRIQRRRRLYGAKKWSSETVYAITDPPAEQATAADVAACARGHWTVENTVHWVRNVVFGEDKSQVRTRNTPAVPATVRDLVRGALKLAGYDNTDAGRRAHTERTASSASTASPDQPDIQGNPGALCWRGLNGRSSRSSKTTFTPAAGPRRAADRPPGGTMPPPGRSIIDFRE